MQSMRIELLKCVRKHLEHKGIQAALMRRHDEILNGINGTLLNDASAKSIDHANNFAQIVMQVLTQAQPLNVTEIKIQELAKDWSERAKGVLVELEYSADEYRHGLIESLQMPVAWAFKWVTEFAENLSGLTARIADKRWLSRFMRRVKMRARESVAILTGAVGKGRAIYCSNGAVTRRKQQTDRNTEIMSKAVIASDTGQQLTLLDVAKSGLGYKPNRRAEVMTRIGGLEAIASKQGKQCVMITITCPSRMHPNPSYGGFNNAYDGTTPKQASEYLGKVWARIRTAFKRADLHVYGMRAAEPHKDGCPHWHIALWYDKNAAISGKYQGMDATDFVQAVVRKYALEDSPNEAGAQQRRAHFSMVQKSAAGYVAKYVAKLTDGHAMDAEDTDGLDSVQNAVQRADAWAGHWAIRAFQFFGTPSVQIWRTVRKLKKDALTDAAPAMRELWESATNSDYEKFTERLGGAVVGKEQGFVLDVETALKLTTYDGMQESKKILGISLAVSASRNTYEVPRNDWVVVWGAIKKGQTLKQTVAGVTCPRINNCTTIEPRRSDFAQILSGELLKREVFTNEMPPW